MFECVSDAARCTVSTDARNPEEIELRFRPKREVKVRLREQNRVIVPPEVTGIAVPARAGEPVLFLNLRRGEPQPFEPRAAGSSAVDDKGPCLRLFLRDDQTTVTLKLKGYRDVSVSVPAGGDVTVDIRRE